MTATPSRDERPYTVLFDWDCDNIGELPIAVHLTSATSNDAVSDSWGALLAHLATRSDAPANVLMRQMSYITVLAGHCFPESNEAITIAADGSFISPADTHDPDATGADTRCVEVSYSRLYSTPVTVPAALDGLELVEWLEQRANRWQHTGELVDMRVESLEDPQDDDFRWQR